MLVSGLLLAPLGASAESPYPADSDIVDYGIRIAKAGGNSPYPTESDVVDYGIRVAA
jgi:hypothetical protein